MLPWIDDVSGLDLRVAVHDWLAVFSHPSAQAFADPNLERGQHAEVFSTHQFRQEPAISIDEYRDGIVRNHASKTHRQHRQCFAQTQRHAAILAEFKHGLSFLARWGDRT